MQPTAMWKESSVKKREGYVGLLTQNIPISGILPDNLFISINNTYYTTKGN
jgi:hypothetical protein